MNNVKKQKSNKQDFGKKQNFDKTLARLIKKSKIKK
jgi:hypothetical protein